MPSPATSRRSLTSRGTLTTPTKSKPVDIGKPLGVYDTASVRDRVRQWQAQGGGVITTPDSYKTDEEKEEKSLENRQPQKSSAARKASGARSADKHLDGTTEPCKRGGQKVSPSAQKENKRSRSRSTPAKRVVSDAHWRANRSPTGSPRSQEARRGVTPGKETPDDGIRVTPVSEPRKSAIRDKRAERKSPTKEYYHARKDNGVEISTTTPSLRKDPERWKRQSAGGRSSDCGDIKSARSRSASPQQESSGKQQGERSRREGPFLTEDPPTRIKSHKRISSPEDESRKSESGGFADQRTSTKAHKDKILSHVLGGPKKIFSKHQPPDIATPRVPSIEAWLSETPDPFVDGEQLPIETIPPLRPTLEEEKPDSDVETLPNGDPKLETEPGCESERVPIEDPNKIWEALDSKDGTRRHVTGSRRKRRIRSSAIQEDNPFPDNFDAEPQINGSATGSEAALKLVDITHDAPDLAPFPSPIRRRGAKRSPASPTCQRRKSGVLGEVPDPDGARSAISSATSPSPVEELPVISPLRPPGITSKRPFPSTGQHRLSTIASVETFNSKAQAAAPSVSEASEATALAPAIEEDEVETEAKDRFDPHSLEQTRSRLAKHADLMSVLSLPKAGNKSIVSARSIRTNRSRLATATVEDLMHELSTDETKYMRELRTLVDGVIPVLLTCVLSKSDSAIAAGLFRPSAASSEDLNFTKPIVDMGIALERLKALHKRIPQQDVRAFLTWAHGAQRVYTEYIKAWRMGFQDVVVNLAPAAETSTGSSEKTDELDEGLPRNKDGDIINGDGERVDVAFLLKRPLVRLKYLSKTLKGIHFVKPSPEAGTLSINYQNLVIDARNRSNEERARLEDEAAASIDPTRARNPRTLAPLTGVSIDKTRHVRARDHFNLSLQHSSGQLLDCCVELLLRDEATSQAAGGGDLLICEVDGSGRWLLFPPIQLSYVSARNGDRKGEIVVMVRGISTSGSEWHELLALRSEDEQTGFEWVQMLGLTPIPPKMMRVQSFLRKHQKTKTSENVAANLEAPAASPSPGKSRTPSPREVEIPMGEQAQETQAQGTSRSWLDNFLHGSGASSGENARLHKKPLPKSPPRTPTKALETNSHSVNDPRTSPKQRSPRTSESMRTPRSLNEALGFSGTSSMSGIRRTKAKRTSRKADDSLSSPVSKPSVSSEPLDHNPTIGRQTTDSKLDQKATSPDHRSLSPVYDACHSNSNLSHNKNKNARPSPSRSGSSVPSMDFPTIPKVRKESPPTTPIEEPEEEPEWPKTPQNESAGAPSGSTKEDPSTLGSKQAEPIPPPTPAHTTPSPSQTKSPQIPVFSPRNPRPRRSSSPLKHEYEPSTASESSSDGDASTVAHNEPSSVSDSSDDEDLEQGDVATPLMPLGIVPPFKGPTPPASLYSPPTGTLAPSNSASQSPYRAVPIQPKKASKTIASIFFWADSGSWQSIHPDECSIVVTPGLIEAYEMSAAHSNDKPISAPAPVEDVKAFSENTSVILSEKEQTLSRSPLIALELTPLVPIRRGTAIDISVRSRPTPKSQITTNTHFMFRSRNPEECEALYALINHSRINNPTYIALQNARPPTTTASSMDRRASVQGGSRSGSWFGIGRSPSYRASSGRSASIAASESSIGTMSSAFSALRRFSGFGGGMFNISRSTISSRIGSRANSVYTSSDNSSGSGASGSGASTPLPPGMNAEKMGLSNAQIRLYIRETASRWRDMGKARLTIMQATPPGLHPGSAAAADGSRPSTAAHLREKRIMVNGNTKGEVLLDAQLGESAFERVARTGIA
ncbi:MAG: hypothetical protein Q9191_005360, partial [Dirinaria sp. TL-2023a]